MQSPRWMVAVTYLEWIRWLATGRLRCSDRITQVQSDDDRDGLFALLDRVGELNFDDDHGVLLASLLDDEMIKIMPARIGNGLTGIWLPIDAVSSFYPVSERGCRLLEADAARAGARLNSAEFEELWIEWREFRRRELAHQRARSLCAAFNLPIVMDIGCVHNDVLSVLKGNTAPRNVSRAESFRGSSAYAWFLSIGVFGQLTDEKLKQEFVSQFGLVDLVKRMEHDYPTSMPVMKSPPIAASRHVSEHLSAVNGGRKLPLSLIAVVFHYRHLLETGRSISLHSLVEDLVLLGVEGSKECAALAAGVIALSMEDAAVTTLLYKSRPDLYRALTHASLEFSLDVGDRISRSLPVSVGIGPEETKVNIMPNAPAREDLSTGQTDRVDGEHSGEPIIEQVLGPAEGVEPSTAVSPIQAEETEKRAELEMSISSPLHSDGHVGSPVEGLSDSSEEKPLGAVSDDRLGIESSNHAHRSGKRRKAESVDAPEQAKEKNA